MIIGIGTDILQIERLQGAYDGTNGRLAEKILGPDEMVVFQQRLARNHKRGIAFLATRFATKEAFSKAIGLGMRMPMTWHSLQTLNEPSGKPVTSYLGALAQFMQEKNWDAHVTVSDEQDMAIAHVIVTQR
jgi:holo-[acyl-carrier protein] synthase